MGLSAPLHDRPCLPCRPPTRSQEGPTTARCRTPYHPEPTPSAARHGSRTTATGTPSRPGSAGSARRTRELGECQTYRRGLVLVDHERPVLRFLHPPDQLRLCERYRRTNPLRELGQHVQQRVLLRVRGGGLARRLGPLVFRRGLRRECVRSVPIHCGGGTDVRTAAAGGASGSKDGVESVPIGSIMMLKSRWTRRLWLPGPGALSWLLSLCSKDMVGVDVRRRKGFWKWSKSWWCSLRWRVADE